MVERKYTLPNPDPALKYKLPNPDFAFGPRERIEHRGADRPWADRP